MTSRYPLLQICDTGPAAPLDAAGPAAPGEKNEFAAGVLALWHSMTGQELMVEELWQQNGAAGAEIREARANVQEVIFQRQETELPHNPYEQERREMDSIRRGDREMLRRSLQETPEFLKIWPPASPEIQGGAKSNRANLTAAKKENFPQEVMETGGVNPTAVLRNRTIRMWYTGGILRKSPFPWSRLQEKSARW